jgi:hypothetical protein
VSRVHGPVDHYSGQSTMDHDHGRARALTEAHAPGRLRPRGLDVMAPKWRGRRGEPHHGQEAVAEARYFAGDERGTVAVVEA